MPVRIEDLKRSQYLGITNCNRFKEIKQELVANCDHLKEIREKKRDEKRDFRGILAINQNESSSLRQYCFYDKIRREQDNTNLLVLNAKGASLIFKWAFKIKILQVL